MSDIWKIKLDDSYKKAMAAAAPKPPKYAKTNLQASHLAEEDLALIDFYVDTALSWDGNFPKLGRGDYIVWLSAWDREPAAVIVSRRYTSATSHDDAAEIALDAYAERHDYLSDGNGNILPIKTDDNTIGIPCWVERATKIT